MEFYEFASAWLLGTFTTSLTNSMTNDSTAIVQCRMSLLDLERELENLRRSQTDFYRDANADSKKINTIKTILKLLNVHYAGLFIKYPKLQKCIDDSLNLIILQEDDPKENYPPFIAIELGNIWGQTDRLYKASKIKDMQYFFHAGFMKRSLIRLNEKYFHFIGVIMKKYVVKSYLIGFMGSIALTIFAYLLANCINSFHFLKEQTITLFQTISIIPTASALYGQCTWDIQSWNGDTPAEKLNQKLFKVFSTFGFFLGVLSFLLKP